MSSLRKTEQDQPTMTVAGVLTVALLFILALFLLVLCGGGSNKKPKDNKKTKVKSKKKGKSESDEVSSHEESSTIESDIESGLAAQPSRKPKSFNKRASQKSAINSEQVEKTNKDEKECIDYFKMLSEKNKARSVSDYLAKQRKLKMKTGQKTKGAGDLKGKQPKKDGRGPNGGSQQGKPNSKGQGKKGG